MGATGSRACRPWGWRGCPGAGWEPSGALGAEGRGVPTAAAVPGNKAMATPKPQRNLPREAANSKAELELFTGSTLFLEVGSRVWVCACARMHGADFSFRRRMPGFTCWAPRLWLRGWPSSAGLAAPSPTQEPVASWGCCTSTTSRWLRATAAVLSRSRRPGVQSPGVRWAMLPLKALGEHAPLPAFPRQPPLSLPSSCALLPFFWS